MNAQNLKNKVFTARRITFQEFEKKMQQRAQQTKSVEEPKITRRSKVKKGLVKASVKTGIVVLTPTAHVLGIAAAKSKDALVSLEKKADEL